MEARARARIAATVAASKPTRSNTNCGQDDAKAAMRAAFANRRKIWLA
ncbi:hypothetical protein CDS [Bradyrhizobium sp.]|nr:hypothetical protein CDS [Bradyrhizobium sp.]